MQTIPNTSLGRTLRALRKRLPHALATVAAVAMFTAPVTPAQAQAYPSKGTINVIVGYAPGGGLDTFCRLVLQAVSTRLGQSMVVQNRPGADGHIGLVAVGRATPDGYTLSCVPHSMTQSVHMSPIAIDIFKDLVPVVQLATWRWNLMVRADGPIKSMPDLIAAAKAKPNGLSFGTSGAAAKLTAGLIQSKGNFSLLVVPFTGTAPAITALLGGHIDMTVTSLLESVEFTKSGRMRAIALLAAERDPAQPDLPAISEFLPDLDPSAWYGVVAPAGTPREIIDQLNAAFSATVNAAPLKDQLNARGWYPKTGTPAQFGQLMRADHERYGQIIKQFNIKG